MLKNRGDTGSQTVGRGLAGQRQSAVQSADSFANLPDNRELAERVDALVARFDRRQDTLGDKLLPAFLRPMQEAPGTAMENLDRAERLGLLSSADE